jgi:tRNA uridine 5-carboxymethylaminomethyl modification enzyme
MAGINAGCALKDLEPVVIDRTNGYIGILIDDLITKGTDEPYRMFTSRAEFRLHLRIDNADQRLTPVGHRVGLIAEAHWKGFCALQNRRARVLSFLGGYRPRPEEDGAQTLYRKIATSAGDRPTVLQLLKRPEVTIRDVSQLVRTHTQVDLRLAEWRSIETEIKYGGYLAQQKRQIDQLHRLEGRRIPPELSYAGIPGLSREVIEKMERIRPSTLGQASRIPGVTPAAVSVLNVHLEASSRSRPHA